MAYPTTGQAPWGNDLKNYIDDADATRVPKVETRTGTAPARRVNLNYSVATSDPNIAEVAVQGVLRSWSNEVGFLRGRPPSSTYADALARAIVESGDFTGTSGGGGGAFEIVDRRLPDTPKRRRWRRMWEDGSLVRNGIVMADTYVRATSSDPIPADLPPGTVVHTIAP